MLGAKNLSFLRGGPWQAVREHGGCMWAPLRAWVFCSVRWLGVQSCGSREAGVGLAGVSPQPMVAVVVAPLPSRWSREPSGGK